MKRDGTLSYLGPGKHPTSFLSDVILWLANKYGHHFLHYCTMQQNDTERCRYQNWSHWYFLKYQLTVI